MSSGLFNSKPLHISQVESFEVVIGEFFDLFEIKRDQWSFIGSIGKKEFSTDVDIAMLFNDLDWWVYNLEKWGFDYKVAKGFNQVSFGYPFDGQLVQVDLMLTKNLEWSKFIYYSPNLSTGESEFKGIYRNLLLSSLIITESRDQHQNGDIGQYILRLDQGLFWVVKSFSDENGILTKKSRIIEEKFITNVPQNLALMFGVLEPIMTFEQLWNQVKVRFRFEEIKERFEKFCKQSKLEIPNYARQTI